MEIPPRRRGNKAQVACTFPLDPMASYEPVWGIWDEHDSDLQWAGAALFMWERKTRGIVSRASGPAPGIWRTHVHTPGPKHTHLAHMLPKRDWYYIRRRIHFSDGGQGRRDKCWAHETLSKLFLGHKKESIGSMTSMVSNSVWAKGAKMMKGFLMATITIACLRRSWWLQHRHLIYSICLVSLQYHLLNLMVGYWLCLRVWSHLYINSLCHHISGVPASIVVSAVWRGTWYLVPSVRLEACKLLFFSIANLKESRSEGRDTGWALKERYLAAFAIGQQVWIQIRDTGWTLMERYLVACAISQSGWKQGQWQESPRALLMHAPVITNRSVPRSIFDSESFQCFYTDISAISVTFGNSVHEWANWQISQQ